MDPVNPISGKIKIKIFSQKLLTKMPGCGIIKNSARVDHSRAAEKVKYFF
jgi:hypothetical protein